MTDRSKRGPSRKGRTRLARPPRLWDPLVRISHWGIAVVVLTNAVVTKGGGSVHIAVGWTGLALLILRLSWGLMGPPEARFSAFPPNPLAALRHLRGLMAGRAAPHPSHNPAGAMMVYALWACLAVITLTGLAMNTNSPMRQAELEAQVASGDWSAIAPADKAGDDEGGAGVVKEVHEVTANLMLFLALLHVAGVVVEGRALRLNLVAAMLWGDKGQKK